MPASPSPSLAAAVALRFEVEHSPAFERILEMILNPDEMRLLLATPAESAAIAAAVGRPLPEVAAALHDLYVRGIVSTIRNKEGRLIWTLPPLGLLMDGVHFDPATGNTAPSSMTSGSRSAKPRSSRRHRRGCCASCRWGRPCPPPPARM